MTRGPGRYDQVASDARVAAEAEGVCLLVLGGKKGDGFSVQVTSFVLLAEIPVMLRRVAVQIEHDLIGQQGNQ